jgi:hypothetical protein
MRMAHSTRRHPRGMSTVNDRCGAHRRSEGCEKALPPRGFLWSKADVLVPQGDVSFGSQSRHRSIRWAIGEEPLQLSPLIAELQRRTV